MSGVDHTAPGAAAAALACARWAEIIPDPLHVGEGALRAALRAIPNLYGVTDAVSAAGMPDGTYPLGPTQLVKRNGAVRTSADSTRPGGSLMTMDAGFRTLVDVGLAVEEASRRLSLLPASYLGLNDRGRLEVEAWSDVVVLNSELEVVEVFVEGARVEPLDAAGGA